MSFKKFSADQLFDGYNLLNDQQVLITTEDGRFETIADIRDAGDDVQAFSGILSPGFINCHCHLELSHMKGMIGEGMGLADFVLKVVTQRHLPEEQILAAIQKAEDEMIDNGIVAVGDICNNTLTLPQKTKGNIRYHNFIEASGFNPEIAAARFERSLSFYNEYTQHLPAQSSSIVPHAPYSVADELWELIIHFPGNRLMTMHNQETIAENEWFIDKKGDFVDFYKKMNIDTSFFLPSGKSSLQSCLLKFLKNQPLILVHNVHTTEEDLLFSRASGREISWCFCPNANRYIGGQLPAIDLFIDHGSEIVLGTDSLASNHQLSILEEIRTIRRYFPGIAIDQVLRWATLNGARALQMDKLLGSFEAGKQPGVLLCENDLSSVRRLL
ncbi:MAG TPA: amidohydrolase family protein [Chitinophagaceae bacterium]|nr:amidohydrolase family protein [Chitinophagaceae bacterium]